MNIRVHQETLHANNNNVKTILVERANQIHGTRPMVKTKDGGWLRALREKELRGLEWREDGPEQTKDISLSRMEWREDGHKRFIKMLP